MPAVGVRSLAVLALLVMSVAACSGAGNQDLFEGSSEQDTTGTDPTSTPAPPGPPGNLPEAGPVTPVLPPPAADAGPPPEEKCTPEAEPNNESAKATPFTSRLCGKIDSATDVDWATFKVPMNAKSVSWKHSEKNGRVIYRFFTGGVPVPMAQDELQAVPGATYTVQMRAQGTDKPTYELGISFK